MNSSEEASARELRPVSPYYLLLLLFLVMCPLTWVVGLLSFLFGHISWLFWISLFPEDYRYMTDEKMSRSKKRRNIRYLHSLCAGCFASCVSQHILRTDIWKEDPDFRGGFVLVMVGATITFLVMYLSLRLCEKMDPWLVEKKKSKHRARNSWLHYAFYYSLFFALAVLTSMTYPLPGDRGFELLLLTAMAVTCGIAIFQKDICSRNRFHILGHFSFLVFSLSALGICFWGARWQWQGYLPWGKNVSQLWDIFILSSICSLLLLIVSFCRRDVEKWNDPNSTPATSTLLESGES